MSLPKTDMHLYFPLSKEEHQQLKQGKAIVKHYHDVCFPNDTVAVVVGKNWKHEDYDYLRYRRGRETPPRGIDIAGVHLTDEQIDKLDKGAWVVLMKSPDGFPIHVTLIDQEVLNQLHEGKGRLTRRI